MFVCVSVCACVCVCVWERVSHVYGRCMGVCPCVCGLFNLWLLIQQIGRNYAFLSMWCGCLSAHTHTGSTLCFQSQRFICCNHCYFMCVPWTYCNSLYVWLSYTDEQSMVITVMWKVHVMLMKKSIALHILSFYPLGDSPQSLPGYKIKMSADRPCCSFPISYRL